MTPTPDTSPAAVEAMIERLLAGDLCVVELAPEAAAMLRAVVSERDTWRDKYNALAESALKHVGELGRDNGRKDVEIDAARASQKAAEAEAAALRDALTKMRGYAVHDDGCGVNALSYGPYNPPRCTCGLSDLIKENHDGR